jgi:putative hydrolase of the HAD superfamily
MKIGLASSSKREWIDRYIKAHRIDQFFDCIKTIDNAHKPKPDPEIYLLALKCLGFAPSEVIALEDSFNGITAANNCRLFCDRRTQQCHQRLDFSQADLIIQHLSRHEFAGDDGRV